MSDEIVLRTLRVQSWERAKGELNCLLHTFWDDQEQYEKMRMAVDNFVEHVEEHALQE